MNSIMLSGVSAYVVAAYGVACLLLTALLLHTIIRYRQALRARDALQDALDNQ